MMLQFVKKNIERTQMMFEILVNVRTILFIWLTNFFCKQVREITLCCSSLNSKYQAQVLVEDLFIAPLLYLSKDISKNKESNFERIQLKKHELFLCFRWNFIDCCCTEITYKL